MFSFFFEVKRVPWPGLFFRIYFSFHICVFRVLCSTIMSASLKIFALLTTVVSASDINVKYYFGSRWPGCKQFGSGDFLKIFADFNATTTFELHPAVRTVTGPCIEESNCNWELATVCAFNQTDISGQVQFLGCVSSLISSLVIITTSLFLFH